MLLNKNLIIKSHKKLENKKNYVGYLGRHRYHFFVCLQDHKNMLQIMSIIKPCFASRKSYIFLICTTPNQKYFIFFFEKNVEEGRERYFSGVWKTFFLHKKIHRCDSNHCLICFISPPMVDSFVFHFGKLRLRIRLRLCLIFFANLSLGMLISV